MPIGTVFIAVKRDHDFLVSQSRNKPNTSSDSINFGPYNTKEHCSNSAQVAPANTNASMDSSQLAYHAQRQDTDVEHLGRVVN